MKNYVGYPTYSLNIFATFGIFINDLLTYTVRSVIIMLPIKEREIDAPLYGLAFGCFE